MVNYSKADADINDVEGLELVESCQLDSGSGDGNLFEPLSPVYVGACLSQCGPIEKRPIDFMKLAVQDRQANALTIFSPTVVAA